MGSDPSELDVEWAHRVWLRLSRWQCAGLLFLALSYEVSSPNNVGYIESMSQMPWPSLGRPLQLDITRELLRLKKALS